MPAQLSIKKELPTDNPFRLFILVSALSGRTGRLVFMAIVARLITLVVFYLH